MTAALEATPVAEADRPLAALLEAGLPLVPRPFDHWAQALGRTPASVLATLQQWLDQGTLRRIGAIVRHHELGFDANAMTVFDIPDAAVDRCGEALAHEVGVTLAYRRERAPGWPYNLYCMVHGRDRTEVLEVIARATGNAGLAHYPHEVLFSCRRFKQTGPRRFRALPEAAAPSATPTEVLDAVAG
jgi:DNA-binding Lrp family transcriptional regulator